MTSNADVWNAGLSLAAQIVALYLIAAAAAALLRQPGRRAGAWQIFLSLAIADWAVWLVRLGWPAAAGANATRTGLVPGAREMALHGSVPGAWAALAPRLAVWLFAAYLGVVAALALRATWRWLKLRRMLGRGHPASGSWRHLFALLCAEQGVICHLLVIPGIASPAMTGWWRPVVLIPESLQGELDETVLVWILRHELAHVRRRDFLRDRLAAAVCTLLHFHPAVWLALRHLRQERELACDEEALKGRLDQRAEYADCLMRMAKWRMLAAGRLRRQPVGFTRSGSALAQRIRAVLRAPKCRPAWMRVAGLVSALALAAGAGWIVPKLGVDLAVVSPLVVRRVALPGPSAEGELARASRVISLPIKLRPKVGFVAASASGFAAFPPEGRRIVAGPKVFVVVGAAEAPTAAPAAGADSVPAASQRPIWSEAPTSPAGPNSAARVGRGMMARAIAILGRIAVTSRLPAHDADHQDDSRDFRR